MIKIGGMTWRVDQEVTGGTKHGGDLQKQIKVVKTKVNGKPGHSG